MILISTKTPRKCYECSMEEAGRIIGRTGKTVGLWLKESLDSDSPYFKRFGDYELYFDKEVIKQNKGNNLKLYR